jgi:hypothetical protein
MILKYGLRGLSKTQVCAQASACFSTGRCQKQAIGQRPMSSATSPEFKEKLSQMLKIGFRQSNKKLF